MGRHSHPWFRDGRGWYVTHAGKQVRLTGPDGTKPDADRAWHRLAVDAPDPKLPAPDLTVAHLADLFLHWVADNLAAETLAWHRSSLQSFAEIHGAILAVAVKPLHVTSWLKVHPGWCSTTRNIRVRSVARCWSWSVGEGHLRENPLKGLRLSPVARRVYLTPDQARAILDAASGSFRVYLEFLAETGARPGEAENASAAGWDRESGTLRVLGKTGERLLYLSPRASEIVAECAAANPDGLLLRTPMGCRWSRGYRFSAMKLAAEKAGVKAVPYQLRHLFATLAVERGVDPLTLAALMGHKNLTMLMKYYYHPQTDHLLDAVKRARGCTSDSSASSPASPPSRTTRRKPRDAPP